MINRMRRLVGVAVVVSLLGGVGAPALAKAPATPERPIEEAVDLMYAAQGILLAEEEEVDVAAGPASGLVSLRPAPAPAENPAEQILVRLINATKEQIRDNRAACQTAVARLESETDMCALQLLEDACAQEDARLDARLALLRRLRGDRRKAFTRAWDSVRRSARSVWHRLGPTGRSFFRAFGRDVVQTVATGGALNGGVVRTLFLNRARSMAHQKVRDAAGRLVERAIVGDVRADLAAGDPCAERTQAAAVTPTGAAPSWLDTLPLEDQFAGDGESCQDAAWLDEEWPEIEAQLLSENKACQAWPTEQYRICLEDQAAQGACPSDAAAACADQYRAIPTDTLSVSGAKGDTDYAWNSPDEMSFSYGGGSANGTVHVERKDSLDECVYAIDVSLTGSFDYATCSFKGTGHYSWTARQTNTYECILLGDKGELIEIPITWEAKLNSGNVHGLIHRDAGNAFYFDVPVGE